MSKSGKYHHGSLRIALLKAAEAELAEKGVDGFTLRGCARRAGVSHAAPAHHFSNAAALLTEMAAVAFEQLAQTIQRRSAGVPHGTLEHLTACALGYVEFARSHPHHFRLMFRHEKLDHGHKHAIRASEAAFQIPVRAVAAYFGDSPGSPRPELMHQAITLWTISHGFSDLLLAGQFDPLFDGSQNQWIEERLRSMIETQFGDVGAFED